MKTGRGWKQTDEQTINLLHQVSYTQDSFFTEFDKLRNPSAIHSMCLFGHLRAEIFAALNSMLRFVYAQALAMQEPILIVPSPFQVRPFFFIVAAKDR